MPTPIKIKKGQRWRNTRGILWARVIKVLPDGRIEVEKYNPLGDSKPRVTDISERTLRGDYSLVEGAT